MVIATLEADENFVVALPKVIKDAAKKSGVTLSCAQLAVAGDEKSILMFQRLVEQQAGDEYTVKF